VGEEPSTPVAGEGAAIETLAPLAAQRTIAGKVPQCQVGNGPETVTAIRTGKALKVENPGAAAARNKAARCREKQTPEEVRNLERGRCWARQTQVNRAP